MKLAPECRTCLLTKVRSQSELVTNDEEVLAKVTSECTDVYDRYLENDPRATVAAGEVHRTCYALIGSDDPYTEMKLQDNAAAAQVAAAVRPNLHTLHDYMTAAIIGNTIDYGVTGHEISTDLVAFFEKMLAKGLALDDSEEFFKLADRVVYFTDNCGEVIFDKLFSEELRKNGSHVTIVVKEKPMLNDVTVQEAADIRLEDAADVVLHGGGGAQLGSHPPYFPPEVKDAVDHATLIISKGLANYESLTEYEVRPPVAYLMMVKCDAVGRDIGAKKGDMIAVLKRQ
ncbi:damage-control phosphatase ARMT1 family protein [uncultured Methanocorpusculum sp.]|nr:ARMT1-like domain-containing protein [uncultured Methanocorpusculum sp.]